MKRNYVDAKTIESELAQFSGYELKLDISGPDLFSIYLLPSQELVGKEYPNIMNEIGWQRKRSFANKGAGGHTELDIDQFDKKYEQLVVVRREGESCEIVGGYRFFVHRTAETLSQLDMGRLFDMKGICQEEYLPAVELGRSWAKPEYRGDNLTFSIVVLGLGLIRTIVYNDTRSEKEKAKLWFGKVTNPGDIEDILLQYFDEVYPDPKELMYPKNVKAFTRNEGVKFVQMSAGEAYSLVKPHVKKIEIWSIYLRISKIMYTCHTAENPEFGEEISETGLAIPIGQETPTMIKMFVQPVEDAVKKNEFLMGLYK